MRVCDPIAFAFCNALVGIETKIEEEGEDVRAVMFDCDGQKTALVPADGVGERAGGVAGAEP